MLLIEKVSRSAQSLSSTESKSIDNLKFVKLERAYDCQILHLSMVQAAFSKIPLSKYSD